MNHATRKITKVGVLLTNKCNARCAHCGQNSGPEEEGVLSTQRLTRFLDAFTKRWGMKPCLAITGGEPMLYPKLTHDVAAICLRYGVRPCLVTNAFWAVSFSTARATAKSLADAGLGHFWIGTGSFHMDFVPVDRVRHLILALHDLDLPYYVNFNYVFPCEDGMGRTGIPAVHSEIDHDILTFWLHRAIAALTRDGAHGWERILDHGRGAEMIDQLGPLAGQARAALRQSLDAMGPPNDIEIDARGDVFWNGACIGNVDSDAFPAFLDVLAHGQSSLPHTANVVPV